jgi:ATP-dependent Zn protease
VFAGETGALGSRRDQPGSHSKATLNQLLGEMVGSEQNGGTAVVCATNLRDSLDSVCPGRFDSAVTVELPDLKVRREMLHILAKDTAGFSR